MNNIEEISQALFDKAAEHLLKQNEKAMSVWGGTPIPRCAYRGENGKMCAVGCLISDEHYRPDMEGANPNDLLTEIGASNGFDPEKLTIYQQSELIYMLDRLQSVHDCNDPDEWKQKLEYRAKECGLEWKHG